MADHASCMGCMAAMVVGTALEAAVRARGPAARPVAARPAAPALHAHRAACTAHPLHVMWPRCHGGHGAAHHGHAANRHGHGTHGHGTLGVERRTCTGAPRAGDGHVRRIRHRNHHAATGRHAGSRSVHDWPARCHHGAWGGRHHAARHHLLSHVGCGHHVRLDRGHHGRLHGGAHGGHAMCRHATWACLDLHALQGLVHGPMWQAGTPLVRLGVVHTPTAHLNMAARPRGAHAPHVVPVAAPPLMCPVPPLRMGPAVVRPVYAPWPRKHGRPRRVVQVSSGPGGCERCVGVVAMVRHAMWHAR
mmetsp:Transcript_10951/g.23626  ORF Transcript_10951/g.23626 Transcript_10951/m.23626 type:complete len:304 (-) Transcript_10951:2116-3027(-)